MTHRGSFRETAVVWKETSVSHNTKSKSNSPRAAFSDLHFYPTRNLDVTSGRVETILKIQHFFRNCLQAVHNRVRKIFRTFRVNSTIGVPLFHIFPQFNHILIIDCACLKVKRNVGELAKRSLSTWSPNP